MKTKRIFVLTLAAIAIFSLAYTSAGCARGSLVTKDFSNTDFTGLQISSAFKYEIKQSDTFSVAVTIRESMVDNLDISQSGKTLKIGLKPVSLNFERPTVKISMPDLQLLDVSGASQGSATGFKSSHDFSLDVSGAGSANLDVEAGNTDVDVSGASHVTGRLKTADTTLHVSGASSFEVNGSGNAMTLNVSGASHARLAGFALEKADATVGGASGVDLNVANKLDVNLSGASTLTYRGNPQLGTVNVSGASNLKHQ